MRTKNRIPALAILLIALTVLVLGLRPAQAQDAVQQPTPAATAWWKLLDNDNGPTGSGIRGEMYRLRLMVVPADDSEPVKWSLNAAGLVNTCFYQTLTGISDQLGTFVDFDVQVRDDAPNTCTVSGGTVNLSAALPGGPADQTITIESATFSVYDRVFGSIAVVGSSNSVPTGANQRFIVMLTSNVGSVVFQEVNAHLDCGETFEDDYVVLGDAVPINATGLYFYAGMPTVSAPLTCTWSGSIRTNEGEYQLLETSFQVHPIVVGPPPAPTYYANLPLVIR